MTALLLLLLFPTLAFAQNKNIGSDSGLPIPRFVSLKSDHINMRAGPGKQYPIKWVMVRKYLPVKVIREHKEWRQVEDIMGDTGWIYGAMLSGRRNVIVSRDNLVLNRYIEEDSGKIARLSKGVQARLDSCEDGRCYIELTKGVEGWVNRDGLWGIKKDEVID